MQIEMIVHQSKSTRSQAVFLNCKWLIQNGQVFCFPFNFYSDHHADVLTTQVCPAFHLVDVVCIAVV